jgi:hypothetical protein
LVFYSLSSLILSNLKHELLNRLRSTLAANVLILRRRGNTQKTIFHKLNKSYANKQAELEVYAV